mmetsp:Transcript_135010/g.349831  ORF Transcript_135010/g.349831 Transcript_135010/m.349831 type:complete len:243 (+) Transcript_135010:331-1059(+)
MAGRCEVGSNSAKAANSSSTRLSACTAVGLSSPAPCLPPWSTLGLSGHCSDGGVAPLQLLRDARDAAATRAAAAANTGSLGARRCEGSNWHHAVNVVCSAALSRANLARLPTKRAACQDDLVELMSKRHVAKTTWANRPEVRFAPNAEACNSKNNSCRSRCKPCRRNLLSIKSNSDRSSTTASSEAQSFGISLQAAMSCACLLVASSEASRLQHRCSSSWAASIACLSSSRWQWPQSEGPPA